MNFQDAILHVEQVRDRKQESQVGFITPIISSMLASLSTSANHSESCRRIVFQSECEGYAANIGLLDTLSGKYQFPVRSGR